MDTQSLINIGGGVFLSVAGWFARSLYAAVEQLRKDIHQIEVDLPKSYVPKEDWSESLKKIESMLEKIFDKLDQKADK
jgi:hypothetical protein